MRCHLLLAILTGLSACQDPPTHPTRSPDGAVASAPCVSGPVGGRLGRDTRWCGRVLVRANVLVPRGVTLTIDPGTVVRFVPYRGYKNPERRLQLRVMGRLLAVGRADGLIRFTSDASAPQNGDWSMVQLMHAAGSQIAYVVLEFGQHGLNIWNTDIDLSHVVIRFNNWEGLYVENHCRVGLRDSRIYANGYNCIAVEQFTHLTVERSYIGSCGTLGIHVDASAATIRGNLIEGSQEGLCLDNDARVTALGNRFAGQLNAAISCDGGSNRLRLGGNVFEGLARQRAVGCPPGSVAMVERPGVEAPTTLSVGVAEGAGPYLDYIPGDPRHDRYPYVYPDTDETRQVLRKIGSGIGLSWSLAFDGRHLWTANLEGELFRLRPEDGRVLQRLKAPGPQSWGMTFARGAGASPRSEERSAQHETARELECGTLWVNDFARRRIYAVDPSSGAVRHEFAAPDPAGGCKGLAWDGQWLYALGWATHRLYRLDPRSGKVLSSVAVPSRDLGSGVRRYVAGGLTWDGTAFWGPSDRLVRFDGQGRELGWIHSTSERVWDMTWDGEALWTTQRANENWSEFPRLFRVKVLRLHK